MIDTAVVNLKKTHKMTWRGGWKNGVLCPHMAQTKSYASLRHALAVAVIFGERIASPQVQNLQWYTALIRCRLMVCRFHKQYVF